MPERRLTSIYLHVMRRPAMQQHNMSGKRQARIHALLQRRSMHRKWAK
jgi:hypothetical protein